MGEQIMHETVKAKHNYHQVCEITITVLSYSVLYAFFSVDISQCLKYNCLKIYYLQ